MDNLKKVLEKPLIYNENSINYEIEYARLIEENKALKIENNTLKETVVKLAVKL